MLTELLNNFAKCLNKTTLLIVPSVQQLALRLKNEISAQQFFFFHGRTIWLFPLVYTRFSTELTCQTGQGILVNLLCCRLLVIDVWTEPRAWRDHAALLSNSLPSLSVSLPWCSVSIPPGSTLPSDSGPVESCSAAAWRVNSPEQRSERWPGIPPPRSHCVSVSVCVWQGNQRGKGEGELLIRMQTRAWLSRAHGQTVCRRVWRTLTRPQWSEGSWALWQTAAPKVSLQLFPPHGAE